MKLDLSPQELDCPVKKLKGECSQLGERLHGVVGRFEDHFSCEGIKVKAKLLQLVGVDGEFESVQPSSDWPHRVVAVPLVPSWQEPYALKQLESEVSTSVQCSKRGNICQKASPFLQSISPNMA